jgi:arylformamidase
MSMKVWRDYDQAALEAQYDTRSQIGDRYSAFSEERNQASLAARQRLSPRLDVAYGPAPRQRLDIFPLTARTPAAPIAVFVHGGFWRGGDKSSFSYLADGLRSLDAVVVIIGYPLCPSVSLEEVVASVRSALSWIGAQAHDFGGDPKQLWLFGHSAGAHLVAMCCCGSGSERELPVSSIKGAVMVSGMYDLEPLLFCRLNAEIGLDPAQVARLSPVRLRVTTACPLIVAVGQGETAEFHRQADEFVAALASQGARVESLVLASANHYTVARQLATPGSALLARFRAALST